MNNCYLVSQIKNLEQKISDLECGLDKISKKDSKKDNEKLKQYEYDACEEQLQLLISNMSNQFYENGLRQFNDIENNALKIGYRKAWLFLSNMWFFEGPEWFNEFIGKHKKK